MYYGSSSSFPLPLPLLSASSSSSLLLSPPLWARYDNAYLTEPWTTHAGVDEMEALKMRVAELEAELAAAKA